MKTTRFLKVWTIYLAGLLLISIIGCDRDELPTAATTEVTPQKPSTLTGIYWVRMGNIYRANADGTEVENIYSDVSGSASSIALDVAALKIYWTGSQRGVGKIRRADLVGTNVEDILTGLEDPQALALDVAGGKLYWNEGHNTRRANLDGTRLKNIVRTENAPESIALDIAGGKLYWCTNGRISRANLDGINVQDIVISRANDIALDIAGGKLYWTDGNDKIRRANLNGTNVEDVITGLGHPTSIALDVAGGKLYWGDANKHRSIWYIRRANLNGTNVEDLTSGGRIGIPHRIALAPR